MACVSRLHSRANVLAVVPIAGRTVMVGVEMAAALIGVDVAVPVHRDRAIPRDGHSSEVAGAAGTVCVAEAGEGVRAGNAEEYTEGCNDKSCLVHDGAPCFQ